MMGFEFAMVARFRLLAAPFGQDALLQFHRQIGYVGLVFILVHFAISAKWDQLTLTKALHAPLLVWFGMAAMLALVALIASSLWRRRLRLSYEAWHITHTVLALVLVVGALGDFTSRVSELEPGTTVYVDGPHGVFSIDRDEGPGFGLLAGGVGIAGLISMLRTMADRQDVRPALLFYANRDWDGVAFREELETLKDRLDLTLVHVIERPPEDWTGETGYVTAAVPVAASPARLQALSVLHLRARPDDGRVGGGAGGAGRAAGLEPVGDTVESDDGASRAVAAAARAHGAAVIAIGSRGLGAARSALVDSVSSGLVQSAELPVLVVPGEVS